MITTKIAAAVMLAACASAPTVAGATTPSHHKKAQAHAATGTHSKSGKSSAHAAVHGKSAAKSAAHGRHGSVAKAAHAAPVAAAVALTHVQSAPVRRQDKSFDVLSNQFLTALWREDPEAAIEVGKYDTAANLTIPDKAHQAAQLASSTTGWAASARSTRASCRPSSAPTWRCWSTSSIPTASS